MARWNWNMSKRPAPESDGHANGGMQQPAAKIVKLEDETEAKVHRPSEPRSPQSCIPQCTQNDGNIGTAAWESGICLLVRRPTRMRGTGKGLQASSDMQHPEGCIVGDALPLPAHLRRKFC